MNRFKPFIRAIRFQTTKSTEEKLKQIINTTNISSSINTSAKSNKPNVLNQVNPLDNNEKSTKFNLPSHQEAIRNNVTKRVSDYMESFQQAIFKATTTLNDVTGYSAIEQLRKDIEALETDLKDAKNKVAIAREEYANAINQRSASQKEINELLTRKHNWSSSDLERFTELYRNDHGNEQREIETQKALSKWETHVDAVQLKLTQSIATRYHEEQIWSDKIRRASTWGTWFIMGFNVFLFIVATFIVEPWKRRRMVDSFETKVKAAVLDLTHEQSGKFDTIISNQTSSQPKQEYWFQLPISTWTDIKNAIIGNYRAMINPSVEVLKFHKDQFRWLLSFVVVLSGVLGSLTTFFFIT